VKKYKNAGRIVCAGKNMVNRIQLYGNLERFGDDDARKCTCDGDRLGRRYCLQNSTL